MRTKQSNKKHTKAAVLSSNQVRMPRSHVDLLASNFKSPIPGGGRGVGLLDGGVQVTLIGIQLVCFNS